MSRTKTNKVYIVGTLVEVDAEERVSKSTGKDFISGKAVIKSVVENVENLIEVKFIAMKKNKDGSDNKNFIAYKN